MLIPASSLGIFWGLDIGQEHHDSAKETIFLHLNRLMV